MVKFLMIRLVNKITDSELYNQLLFPHAYIYFSVKDGELKNTSDLTRYLQEHYSTGCIKISLHNHMSS